MTLAGLPADIQKVLWWWVVPFLPPFPPLLTGEVGSEASVTMTIWWFYVFFFLKKNIYKHIGYLWKKHPPETEAYLASWEVGWKLAYMYVFSITSNVVPSSLSSLPLRITLHLVNLALLVFIRQCCLWCWQSMNFRESYWLVLFWALFPWSAKGTGGSRSPVRLPARAFNSQNESTVCVNPLSRSVLLEVRIYRNVPLGSGKRMRCKCVGMG